MKVVIDSNNPIICWWSGGITSAVACKIAIERLGKESCRVIMLDTKNEHKDTYRFLKDCEKWYGLKIEVLASDEYASIEDTWLKYNSLNTANGAICSYLLKRRVREKWEKVNEYSHQVFGFEYSKKELNRAKSLKLGHPNTRPIFPLISARLGKVDCINKVIKAGIEVPEAYTLGFQNNNCLNTGCVQGGIGYWKKIQKERPEVFDKMAAMEHKLTDRKGKPVTMLKDQSKKAKESGDTLVFLKRHTDYPNLKCIDDMKGRPVKPLQDCNGFCGTNDLNGVSKTQDELNYDVDTIL